MAKKLLEPITIKGMKLKNRIGFAPILGMPVEPGGFVNEGTIKWFEDKAKGGAGFIMTGTIETITRDKVVSDSPVKEAQGISLYDDKYIPGLAGLVDVIHSYDVRIGAQFAAPGPMMGEGPSTSPFPDPVCPHLSMLDLVVGRIIPVQEIAVEKMNYVKGAIAQGAGRAKAAGFDCVELHCGHGGANLHGAFLSPYYNRRTDNYGGSWENRVRFIVETVAEIRKEVGQDFPIALRFSADELLGDMGITLEASVQHIVPALEKAGVDLLDVTQGSILDSPQGISIPPYYPRGCYIGNAEAVKKSTNLPVIGVGRIVDLDMAERFLHEGKADIIYLGSQLMADPETPKKYFAGRAEDIRKCIGCKPIQCGSPCVINYDSVGEGRMPWTPAQTQKKVLIIGGGVGGMEAARVAALRGHRVTLVEKEAALGGMVADLAQEKMTGEFRNIIDYLGTQLRKLHVEVRVCREAAAADVDEMKPDVVIVACGASMVIPKIAMGKPAVMDHLQACRQPKAVGQRVVLWGLAAAELALCLAEEGKDVTMIGRGGESSIAKFVPGSRQFYALRKLTDINLLRVPGSESEQVSNPQVLLHVEVMDITFEGIKIRNKDGLEKTIPYDTLIISLKRNSNDSLFDQLQGKAPEVYKIGDCAKVGEIRDAIQAANEIARKL